MGCLLSGAKTRVVVVDDNEDAAFLTASMLNILGYNASTAFGGTEALYLCEQVQPSIVFLDLGMPNMNGFEVAIALRKISGQEGVRIVALTGWGDDATRAQARLAGFDGHLQKPASMDALIREIEIATMA
jgi:CheY-like chemotaxis protein